MNIKSIINNLKNKSIYLFKEGNDIRYRASKRMMTDDIRNQIRQHKKEILKLLIIENPYNLPVKMSKAKPIQDNSPTNGSMARFIQGDCLYCLSKLGDDSVDQLVTDPPYGYSFMGKDWDKALPSIEIWKQCLRVLKPGAFAFIMASPRQDVLSRMIRILEEAGFFIGFTSLYWTYATAFPKAHNISKAIDKKFGAKREVISERTIPDIKDTIPATPEAMQLDGSYAGFQPKPAVEVIIVAMKPCDEKTYTEQALSNGKGCTWLDDCRIPYGNEIPSIGNRHKQAHEKGRFPANLLVSDGVLCNGREHATGCWNRWNNGSKVFGGSKGDAYTKWKKVKEQSSAYSRFFCLDAWADLNLQNLPEKVQQNLPFFIVPKASKKEKYSGPQKCDNNKT